MDLRKTCVLAKMKLGKGFYNRRSPRQSCKLLDSCNAEIWQNDTEKDEKVVMSLTLTPTPVPSISQVILFLLFAILPTAFSGTVLLATFALLRSRDRKDPFGSVSVVVD
jgi:hypothetical protein